MTVKLLPYFVAPGPSRRPGRSPARPRRARAAWLVAFNLLCGGIIAAAFWAQDWRYARPTPVPPGLTLPPVGARLEPPAALPRRDAAGPLFVHFFNPACPCSRFNASHVRDLVAAFGDRVTFVAVVQDVEGPEGAKAALERYGLTLPSVADPEGDLAHAFGVYSTPQAVLLDGERRLVFRGNYNTSRYHAARATQFARLALEGLFAGGAPPSGAAWLSDLARRAWGCALPSDPSPQATWW